MVMKKIKALVSLLLILSHPLIADTLHIPGNEEVDMLPQNLIEAIARRAGMDFDFPQNIDSRNVTPERQISDLNSGILDVMWTATSISYEENLLALYYPIYKGILGMRIGIIRSDNTRIFDGVKTLSDLQAFKPGSGRTWADTEILESNGLNVIKTSKYANLFYMLEGGRFDYFPRGIHEPWTEIKDNSHLNLTIEPNVSMSYKMPMYFFVKKGNVALAKRLNSAIESLITDGSFDKMFFADADVQSAFEKSNIKNRRIIELENPFLSKKTPLKRKELWFDPRENE